MLPAGNREGTAAFDRSPSQTIATPHVSVSFINRAEKAFDQEEGQFMAAGSMQHS